MDSIHSHLSSREFRATLSDVIGRVAYGGERVAVTRNGKVAAVLISKQDLENLERLEMEADLQAYRDTRASDDGTRVALEEFESKLS